MSQKDTEYLQNDVEFRFVPLIDRTVRRVATKSLVGICHNDLHWGYVTIGLMKQHDCIGKNCTFLQKFTDYPFWIQYEKRQIALRERKKRIKQKKLNRENRFAEREIKEENLLLNAQQIADNEGFPIIITRVFLQRRKAEDKPQRVYIINYVSDCQADDWLPYLLLAKTMGKKFGGYFMLKHVKKKNGEYATIDEWKKSQHGYTT